MDAPGHFPKKIVKLSHLTITGLVLFLFRVVSSYVFTLCVNFSVFHFAFFWRRWDFTVRLTHTVPDLSHTHSRNPFNSFLPQTTETVPPHTHSIRNNILKKSKCTNVFENLKHYMCNASLQAALKSRLQQLLFLSSTHKARQELCLWVLETLNREGI